MGKTFGYGAQKRGKSPVAVYEPVVMTMEFPTKITKVGSAAEIV